MGVKMGLYLDQPMAVMMVKLMVVLMVVLMVLLMESQKGAMNVFLMEY